MILTCICKRLTRSGSRQQETKTDGEVCLVSMLGQYACLGDLGSSLAIHRSPSPEFWFLQWISTASKWGMTNHDAKTGDNETGHIYVVHHKY